MRGKVYEDNVTGILSAYGGCCLAPKMGQFGSIIYFNGGHSDRASNSIARFDIITRTFSYIKRAKQRYFDGNVWCASPATGWMYKTASLIQDVGNLSTGHIYTHHRVVDKTLLGDTKDAFYLVGVPSIPLQGQGSCSIPSKYPLDNEVLWERIGGSNAIIPSGVIAGASLIDTFRGICCYFPVATSSVYHTVDLQTGTVFNVNYKNTLGVNASQAMSNYHIGYYFTAKDLYLLQFDTILKIINPKTNRVYTVPTTGTPPPLFGGANWVESLRSLVFLDEANSRVYFLTAPVTGDAYINAWTWSYKQLTGTIALRGHAPQHYNRFIYNPMLDCFIWSANTGSPLQIVKVHP
jgi:hypothetical protein